MTSSGAVRIRLSGGLSWIGPWRLRPVALGLVFALLALLITLGPNNRGELGWSLVASSLVPSILAGVGAAGWAAIGRQWQQRHGVRWPSYLVVLAAIAATNALLRLFYSAAANAPEAELPAGVLFVRAFVVALVVNMFIGLLTRRLELQVAATEQALDLARQQQVELIRADEETRRQVSAFLHDRVQAELIAISLELQAAAHEPSEPDQQSLIQLVQRLETLRALDVRSAARTLSPNLDEIDLQTALEELAIQYEPSFAVSIDVDPSIDEGRNELGGRVMLASYRIIEQALLNCAVHAEASHVDIRVARIASGVRVTVADDGKGLPVESTPGRGTTIIAAWVRALDGTWSLRNRLGGAGCELRAELPADGGPHVGIEASLPL